MIFFIVAFFCGTILCASECNQQDQREIHIGKCISAIISQHYQPKLGSRIKIQDVQALKKATRNINGGKLPIPHEAKHRIVAFLVAEFPQEYDHAVALFCRYAQKKNMYPLSVEKTLELLADQYESQSDCTPYYESDSDDAYEPIQLIISLLSGGVLKPKNTTDTTHAQDLEIEK